MPKVKKTARKTKKRHSSGRPTVFTRIRNHFAARLRGAKYRAGAAVRLATVAITAVMLLGVAVLWGGGWLAGAAGGAAQSTDKALAGAGFTVRHVDIIGADRAEADAIHAALGDLGPNSIFTLDAASARQRVESLGWVDEAVVARLLPNRISVTVTERRPAAVWQNDGAFFVVDSDGGVIDGADPAKYTALPVVVGARAGEAAPELLDAYRQFPSVAERVEAAQRVGERRWTLWIDSGMKVHLPEDEGAAALAILNDLQTRRHILDAPASLIDLRDTTRIVIRPMEGHDSIELKGREA